MAAVEQNPFANLDEYEIRHLVQHLDSLRDVARLHRLLAMETLAGRNAWHEAKERIDDDTGFAADIERARARATPPGAGASPDLQLRYALILATMSSLAGNVALELV